MVFPLLAASGVRGYFRWSSPRELPLAAVPPWCWLSLLQTPKAASSALIPVHTAGRAANGEDPKPFALIYRLKRTKLKQNPFTSYHLLSRIETAHWHFDEGFLFVKLLQWSGSLSSLHPEQVSLPPVSVCMGPPPASLCASRKAFALPPSPVPGRSSWDTTP